MDEQLLLFIHTEDRRQIQYTTRICLRLCSDSVRPYLKAPAVKLARSAHQLSLVVEVIF